MLRLSHILRPTVFVCRQSWSSIKLSRLTFNPTAATSIEGADIDLATVKVTSESSVLASTLSSCSFDLQQQPPIIFSQILESLFSMFCYD